MEHPKGKYDVFMSFAGKDTRLKFVDHLYEAFNRSGIKTFKDDVDLERGADIKQYLFQAIEDSLCSVLIISENYAESAWCLDELKKILECRNTSGRLVFPIFYDVNPGDVKHLRNSFGDALAKHEETFKENKEKVLNWRNVLSQIGSISGADTRGKHEADLIQNIVGDVWSYLSSKLPSHDGNLVGIESRVADLMRLLEIGLDDKRFVGIWGMGGLGKTTLARVVSEKISHKFQVSCFLANVRETLLQKEGLVSLQKRLLSHLRIKDVEIFDDYDGMKKIRKYLFYKKVLLVLDDIDSVRQLRNLAESLDWFGEGSRIIITTRDSQLFTSYRVQRIYEMKTMKKDESLQLFSMKAFHKDHPEENYLELSESVVEYAGGLPLALDVLGRFLCGRSEDEWINALCRLKQIPNDDILQVLKISYDVLNDEEKTIFVDIACFFKGWPKKKVTQILGCCDLHPKIGIKVLIEKSLLVETENCELEMHDLLADLGRYISHQESPTRSRLWRLRDLKEVLKNKKGFDAIRAIVMHDYCRDSDKIKLHPEAFSKMSNIRLLLLEANSPLILPRRLKLSSALKVVRWSSFPYEALPLPLDELVHIEMHYSKIKKLWNGIQFMRKLKFIDLSGSSDLTEIPDFSGVPYLEHLCLRGCTSLVKIHPSLGELKRLVEVFLNYCENLEILPRKLETDSLRKLDLCGCQKVAMLPEFGKDMKKLSYLYVSHTSITGLPESLGSVTGLNLSGCKNLFLDKLWKKTHISCQISGLLNLTSLTELYLSECGLNDGSIPEDFGSLSSLILLDLSRNNFVNLPTNCFSSLFQLVYLSLDSCIWLKSLPRLPPRLIRLNASLCRSMEPLSERQLWNLVASLDHENRGRTKYVIFDEDYDDDIPLGFKHFEPAECLLPLRDFCAIIRGSEIPSWFLNKEYYALHGNRGECEIKVKIPPYLGDSEWSGIVVCLQLSGLNGFISWSSKAVEDYDYIRKDWAHYSNVTFNQLCIMVLELNEKTCWRYLTPHNNSLHIQLSTYCKRYTYSSGKMDIMGILGCGWRVICKEDIQEWCTLNDFNQLSRPLLTSHDEVKLPRRVLHNFMGKVCENGLLIQETKRKGPEYSGTLKSSL